MTFDTMQKIVFKNGEYPKNADFEEQLHLLALKGTQAYFRENALTKEEAAGTKSKIREHLLSQTGEDGQSKLIRSGCLKDVADRQDKNRLAAFDEALAGRIAERCGKNIVQIAKAEGRNHRIYSQ